jgi:hypothetical protein
MRSDYALMAFADDRIFFPVANSALIGDNGWTFINANAVGNSCYSYLCQLEKPQGYRSLTNYRQSELHL